MTSLLEHSVAQPTSFFSSSAFHLWFSFIGAMDFLFSGHIFDLKSQKIHWVYKFNQKNQADKTELQVKRAQTQEMCN